MPRRRRSAPALVVAGLILCLIGAIIAVLLGILDLTAGLSSVNINALIDGVIYLALGLLSIVFSFRVRRYYDAGIAILLLIFSVLFIVLGLWRLGLEAVVVGVLLLIGTILIMAGKG